MSWFEKWFNSPLYEKLYSYRNEEEAELLASFIEDKIPKSQYPRLLDLGCGRGRHSITLAEMGYTVKGIDLSPEAISQAESTAKKRGLSNVTFQVEDMRNPLPETFDAILNLFTTFGYFLDDQENFNVLKNVDSMLNEKGLFLIDYLNATRIRKNIVSEESGSYGKLDYQIERKIEKDMVFKTIRFTGSSINDPVQYQERVKLYELEWFEDNFSEIGFELCSVYGDYKGSKFDPETSPRLLMISKKRS